MKNQYFGDRRDYLKYSLIRMLISDYSLSAAVCWLLTKSDGGSDGQKIEYLSDPQSWREYDPLIYDFLLQQVVERGVRDVKALEEGGLLRNCKYFSGIVPDDKISRGKYLDDFLNLAKDSQLVFFDPDMGMEVESVKFGTKDSSKYIYLKELGESFSLGHSLLIYQHFPREKRLPFIKKQIRRLSNQTGAESVFVFHDNEVALFLAAQPDHRIYFDQACSKIKSAWRGLHVSTTICD